MIVYLSVEIPIDFCAKSIEEQKLFYPGDDGAIILFAQRSRP